MTPMDFSDRAILWLGCVVITLLIGLIALGWPGDDDDNLPA